MYSTNAQKNSDRWIRGEAARLTSENWALKAENEKLRTETNIFKLGNVIWFSLSIFLFLLLMGVMNYG